MSRNSKVWVGRCDVSKCHKMSTNVTVTPFQIFGTNPRLPSTFRFLSEHLSYHNMKELELKERNHVTDILRNASSHWPGMPVYNLKNQSSHIEVLHVSPQFWINTQYELKSSFITMTVYLSPRSPPYSGIVTVKQITIVSRSWKLNW